MKSLKLVAVLVVLLSLAWIAQAAGAAGELVNGSFETGNLSGWGSYGAVSVQSGGMDGRYSAAISTSYGTGVVSQTFYAEADSSISGWAFFSGCARGYGSDYGRVTVARVGGSWSSQAFYNSINGWVYEDHCVYPEVWTKWSVTLPEAGAYTIQAYAFSPNSRGTTLYLDGVKAAADAIPPLLTLPASVMVPATRAQGAIYTYDATATDNKDPNPAVSCGPPPGSLFPIGNTTVTCTATDASGNSSTGSFTVLVLPNRALINPGFETGDLTGWGAVGNPLPTVATQYAHEGRYGAGVKTQDTGENVIMAQSFFAEAGDSLSGWTRFSGCPRSVIGGFHQGVVAVNGFNGPAYTNTLFNVQISGNTCGDTGWVQWSATFPSSGAYELEAWTVAHATDSSYLSLDGMVYQKADTTPPVLTLPPSATVEATGATGAAYSYVATATDSTDPSPVVSCSPASGSLFPMGTTTVACTARDASGNQSSGSFTVTVRDTTPPALTLPANITAEATGPAGAAVSYTATANDLVDGARTVTCAPTSGSTFALGVTTVNCSAGDTRGNNAIGSFTVTVRDTTPPTLTIPANMTVEGNTANGANVTLPAATAIDVVDPSPTVTCNPTSGFFELGATTVTCTARDVSGNQSTGSFTVSVRDTTAPVLALPANMTVEGNTTNGATVTLPAVAATDIVDPLPSVSCSPASGFFPLGTATITCTATDASANQVSGSYTVSVVDTTSPETTLLSAVDGRGRAVTQCGSTLSRSITFTFTGQDIVGLSGYQCSLDAGAWSPCTSPTTYNGLAATSHTFRVRATDVASNADQSPASLTWTVLTPAQGVQALFTRIAGMGLPNGVATSLSAPLGQAAALLGDANPANDVSACGKLGAFLNQVDARARSGALTAAQAAELRDSAQAIGASLGCAP